MASGAHFWYPKFTFDLISGHFRSMRNLIFVQIFDKMAAVDHFGCPIFTFDRISDHFRSIQNFFFFILQNGRPFLMSEIHIWSHFWPFQINAHLYFFWKFLTKWQPSTIVDVRNSLLMEFLAISNQYKTFSFLIFFLKMASGAHFWYPKFTFDLISGHFRSMRNLIFVQIFDKMAAVDHFGCPIFTFDRISDHFRSIQNIFFLFYKMAAHFWCPKFTFDLISGHFRSIRNFFVFKLLTKWLPSTILDVRYSLSIAFLAILDQYRI